MGIIVFVYQALRSSILIGNRVISLSFSVISVSLNILLTLMIVIRLIMHKRKTRNAIGTVCKSGGLINTVVTMLIKSCAIPTFTYVL